MHIHAGILIGGRSQRMGKPKALIEYDGATLIERTIATVRPVVDSIALLGTEIDYALPDSCNSIPILPDAIANIGPLGGLLSLLERCEPDDAALLLACDMPFLSSELIIRLRDCGRDPSSHWDAIVPVTSDATNNDESKSHPCCTLYRPSCIPAIKQAIDAKKFGLMRVLQQLRVNDLTLTPTEARWVTNWNTPADISE